MRTNIPSGKTALVTGSTPGIGPVGLTKSTALECAATGVTAHALRVAQ